MQKLYLRELVDYIRDNKPGKDELSRFKIKLCAKHKVRHMPSDIEVLTSLNEEEALLLVQYLQTKPVRSKSGVAVVAVMTKPRKCPHGKCSYCPGGPKSFFGSVPQSYTGREPATRRAMRNSFDPYLQVFNRLEQYIASGHFPQKIELIVMGGTFPASPLDYQKKFVMYLFKALNDFSRFFFNGMIDLPGFKDFFELPGKVDDEKRAKNIRKKVLSLKSNSDLSKEQRRNESAFVRCVGLTIETRPDYSTESYANLMLSLGCTRVELGVQSLSDEVLRKVDRGHTVQDMIAATKVLKDLGFKINYHMMLGLPGSSPTADVQMFRKLFSDSSFQPDMLKIYPCMVMDGTRLFDQYKAGDFLPMTTDVAAATIADIKHLVPSYVRIMRVQRDIPTNACAAGVDRTNLRQDVERLMSEKGLVCKCIRCRQAGSAGKNPALKVMQYDASQGKEFFISAVSCAGLHGFCRLRFPSACLRKELRNAALVRELHVYGDHARIGQKGLFQHRGLGKSLLAKAESIACESKYPRLAVISGVGVRNYYRKLGYRKTGPYMVKSL